MGLVSKESLEEMRRWDQDIGGKTMPDVWEKLLQYGPDFFEGFWMMRKSLMKEPPDGALPRWVKELIIVGVQAALRIPWGGTSHAKNAIKLGATVRQVHEAVATALFITGVSTYAAAGHLAVEAAEEEEKKGRSNQK